VEWSDNRDVEIVWRVPLRLALPIGDDGLARWLSWGHAQRFWLPLVEKLILLLRWETWEYQATRPRRKSDAMKDGNGKDVVKGRGKQTFVLESESVWQGNK
jgi:hypothetical protein